MPASNSVTYTHNFRRDALRVQLRTAVQEARRECLQVTEIARQPVQSPHQHMRHVTELDHVEHTLQARPSHVLAGQSRIGDRDNLARSCSAAYARSLSA